MQIQLIRNATLRLNYAQREFLIDPYLAAKHTRPSYTGRSPNPLVDLPCSPLEVIAGIEMTLISHLHSDHFDPVAQSLLPKDMTIFCQPGDEGGIRAKGFGHVTPVRDTISWQGITITRTLGQHGVGEVSGFVFQAKNEPTLYWAGDTIWYEAVAEVITHMQPDIIITHSCGAIWGDSAPIVMDAEQTIAVCQAAPHSVVIATHMDALDHATVSRVALRAYADAAGIRPEKLLIPEDGERIREIGRLGGWEIGTG